MTGAEAATRSAGFRTHRGNLVRCEVRIGTTDWETLNACIGEDEYDLATTEWSGVAVDVGAHIGGATLALLADNPGLRVVAIEALPANVELLRLNVALNGWQDRCEIIEGAASCGADPVVVAYGQGATPFEIEHRFIGGAIWQDGSGPGGEQVTQQPISLAKIMALYGRIGLVKIDCEGCEWSFLDDEAIEDVAEIRGEYHPREGRGPRTLRAMLEPTHVVSLDDRQDFGPFRAVRRRG